VSGPRVFAALQVDTCICRLLYSRTEYNSVQQRHGLCDFGKCHVGSCIGSMHSMCLLTSYHKQRLLHNWLAAQCEQCNPDPVQAPAA
jgi:hypothetical protein